MPVYLVHDGSFEGLLTALSRGLELQDMAADILAEDQNDFLPLNPVERVRTDHRKASGLMDRLRNEVSADIARRVYYAYCSEIPDIALDLLSYLRLALKHGAEVAGWRANDKVRRINDMARRVDGEIHRLKGLLRFRELADGELWAPVEPDANIIWSLAGHFRRRLGSERWIIHDVKRGYALRHQSGNVSPIQGETPRNLLQPSLSVLEKEYSRLWKRYFKEIAISSRKNPQLQRQNMPKRYWRWLVEMEK